MPQTEGFIHQDSGYYFKPNSHQIPIPWLIILISSFLNSALTYAERFVEKGLIPVRCLLWNAHFQQFLTHINVSRVLLKPFSPVFDIRDTGMV